MWSELISEWQLWGRSAGLPATTLGLRTYHVRRLAKDLGVASPCDVTAADLLRWMGTHGDWAANTRKSYRNSFRAFFGWLQVTGHIPLSPAHVLPPVRVPRGRPRPAPEAAFWGAVRGATDDRSRLMLLLAGVCGLRRGEVARARREDLERDLLGWSLRVVGKGGHVRVVPVTDQIADLIRACPDGVLFPSPRGGGLTPHHVGKIVTACLPPGLTMHTLRHRCGTVTYAATHDLRAVQELLGHAKPETTAIYTGVDPAAIRAAVTAAAARAA